MNIIDHSLKFLLAACLVAVTVLPTLASDGLSVLSDTTFSCNDLIHVSVNEDCEADIDADEILEGYDGPFTEIELTVKYFYDTIPLPIPSIFVGETVKIIATHLPSGTSCWGEASIEDKWAPQLNCSDYQLACFEQPNSYPNPSTWDNCGTPSLSIVNENIDASDICNGVVVTRTYRATDDAGNISEPCTQTFYLEPNVMPDLPADVIWSCEEFATHPNIILPKKKTNSLFSTGSGIPNIGNSTYCGYHVAHSDLTISGCGMTFTILRSWTVLNWCTGEIITEDAGGDDWQQLIKVEDKKAPVIEMEPFTINANVGGYLAGDCRSMDFLPPAEITDNCHAFELRILTPIGEVNYINGMDGSNGGMIPAPGLSLGEHVIIYEAEDYCGNVDSIQVTITVADLTAPVAICDELTNVSLGVNGEAEVWAETFDDGSYDNCCLDSFLVRRMADECIASDTLFGENITLCCTDVGDTVSVVFRALDCHGNFNDCMVLVEVEEKLPPEIIECPTGKTIDCGFYTDSLQLPLTQNNFNVLDTFGYPTFLDNCQIVFLDISVEIDLDQCQTGALHRHWQVTDSGGNGTLDCTQTILVEHSSDWVVSFPPDVSIECGEEIPDTGEPEIFFDDCELIAVSFEDEIFTSVVDACYKIARTWVVINWCEVGSPIEDVVIESPEIEIATDLDTDGDIDVLTYQDGLNSFNFDSQQYLRGAIPDGFITHQQIIMVNDSVKPTVDCNQNLEVCVEDSNCGAYVVLPFPDILDCSLDVLVSAQGDLGAGLGPFSNVPPGIYSMVYIVSDQCNNTGYCNTEIVVRDCKPPTAFCENGIIVSICDEVPITVYPDIFNGGSSDNCPDGLTYSYSSNPSDTSLVVDCADLGFILIELWVTDAAGNQSFCQTFLNVDNPCGDCQGPPLVAGTVMSPDLFPIAGVKVSVNGDVDSIMETHLEGAFEFELPFGGDYSISAAKNSIPLNGVTTFDLVLISKHILGTEPFDNAYKIIAADANKSNSVTTADILLLRKLILQIESGFPDGHTWRFVKKDLGFVDPLQPFEPTLIEVLNLNNLAEDLLNADFIGIKLGDVNFSADYQQ